MPTYKHPVIVNWGKLHSITKSLEMLHKKNYLLATIVATALLLPALEGCKKGENDPGLSLKSRDARISGVWTLSGGTMTETAVATSSVVYNDKDCKDVLGEDYNFTIDLSETFSYSSGSMNWVATGTATDDIIMDYGTGLIEVKEEFWEDLNNTTVNAIVHDLVLTIRQNGTYSVTMNYDYNETKFPLGDDRNAVMQFGKRFTNTVTVDGTWWWEDNRKNKSGISFSAWPMISVSTNWYYDQVDINNNPIHKYNYVSSISTWTMNNATFNVDMLKSKELSLVSNMMESDNDVDATDKYELYNTAPATAVWEDCIETNTDKNTWSQSAKFDFTGDGKNVKE